MDQVFFYLFIFFFFGHNLFNLMKEKIKSLKNHAVDCHLDKMRYIMQYLHSPTFPLDYPNLDRRGSYIDERHSFRRRYA